MGNLIKHVVGIDIAKEKFDVCLMSLDNQLTSKIKGSRKFTNSLVGFNEFVLWLKKNCNKDIPVQFLMEATGVYYEKLAIYLTDSNYNVFVVVPNKARRYLQSLGIKSKNDKIDAKGLALMCLQHKFDPWKPISKFYYELRLLTRHHQNTTEMKTALLNQLHALEYSGYSSKEVEKQIKKVVALLDKQLIEGKNEIDAHIKKDKEVEGKVKMIQRIKGLSILSIATIIAETNGFELFSNMRQLVSYAGYDVVENQSGTHFGRTKISKKGNSRIRRILHMPSLIVVRCKEPVFENLYTRVFERTKCKMKGYVAVQKKLLELIYTLWKKDKAYDRTINVSLASGNGNSRALFLVSRSEIDEDKILKVVPLKSSTTQDKHRYNESSEALFLVKQN